MVPYAEGRKKNAKQHFDYELEAMTTVYLQPCQPALASHTSVKKHFFFSVFLNIKLDKRLFLFFFKCSKRNALQYTLPMSYSYTQIVWLNAEIIIQRKLFNWTGTLKFTPMEFFIFGQIIDCAALFSPFFRWKFSMETLIYCKIAMLSWRKSGKISRKKIASSENLNKILSNSRAMFNSTEYLVVDMRDCQTFTMLRYFVQLNRNIEIINCKLKARSFTIYWVGCMNHIILLKETATISFSQSFMYLQADDDIFDFKILHSNYLEWMKFSQEFFQIPSFMSDIIIKVKIMCEIYEIHFHRIYFNCL